MGAGMPPEQRGETRESGQADAGSGQLHATAGTRVALVIFPGVQALDVAGPLDAFAEANAYVPAGQGYLLTLVGARREPMRASNGMCLVPDRTFAEAREPFGLVLIAGGPGLPTAPADAELSAWLRDAAAKAERFGSICTGAFALGHAGLLDERTVTTHWQNAARLAEQFPRAHVEQDRLYIQDGALVTSAGVTAGIDLALALIQADHGAEVALAVAKRLVVVAYRQGGQSQFSPQLVAPSPPASPITLVREHVLANLAEQSGVETLAHVARMSARSFSRAFKQQTGVTPADFVESVRVDAARGRLEASDEPVKAVAIECGFGGADRMRLVFLKRIGVTPTHYRASFRRA